MCKSLVAIAFLALIVAVIAEHPAPPSAEEVQAELAASGISTEAAAGIVAVGEKYKSALEAAKGNKEAAEKVFEDIKTETDNYVKTQSSADQTAYAAFVEKKKSEFQKHHSTPAH
uniref:SXP/RAL-2 family protein Ani s 5-like cation-binding domain-containing protein n=1 Tax=Caenorhabditis japonica TaxID=281687 RepID=A0A8R1HQ52_CAEJA